MHIYQCVNQVTSILTTLVVRLFIVFHIIVFSFSQNAKKKLLAISNDLNYTYIYIYILSATK